MGIRKQIIQLRKMAKRNPRTALQASRVPNPGWGRQRVPRRKPLGKMKGQLIQGIYLAMSKITLEEI